MYRVEITGQSVRAVTRKSDGNSVLGTVGVEQVQFTFDRSWKGLTKFACFKNTGRPRRQQEVQVALDDTGIVTIPWEMYTATGNLYVGVLGMDDGVVTKPTLWTLLGCVHKGVDPDADPAKEATPTLVQQLIKVVESVREDADNGVFDGEQGPKGDKGDKGEKATPDLGVLRVSRAKLVLRASRAKLVLRVRRANKVSAALRVIRV